MSKYKKDIRTREKKENDEDWQKIEEAIRSELKQDHSKDGVRSENAERDGNFRIRNMIEGGARPKVCMLHNLLCIKKDPFFQKQNAKQDKTAMKFSPAE